MLRILFYVSTLFLLNSCVSLKQYAELKRRHYKTAQENAKLKKQLKQAEASLESAYKNLALARQPLATNALKSNSNISLPEDKPNDEITVDIETAAPYTAIDNREAISTNILENTKSLYDKNEIIISEDKTSFHNPYLFDKAKAPYLNETAHELLYYMNLSRVYPKEFAITYLKSSVLSEDLNKTTDPYLKSLYQTLITMKPVPPLSPNETLSISATCHAKESGISGYIGHDRSPACSQYTYNAECCHYGEGDGLDIVLNLLIDYGVPSYGHRFIILNNNYNSAGIGIEAHSIYGTNAVIDFSL